MVNEITVGKRYRLMVPLATTCCEVLLSAGTELKVSGQFSPNRVFVRIGDMGHKVKLSGLRMAVEEIDEIN